jgi:hypothetical protein
MSEGADDLRFHSEIKRVAKAMRKAIPRDADTRAVLLVCAETIRAAIEAMPLELQPEMWAAIIGDMKDHSA